MPWTSGSSTCWGSAGAVRSRSNTPPGIPERVRRLAIYGGYAEGRLRGARAMGAKDAKLLLDMTRIGWGQQDHAFCRVWGSYFQPGGTLAHYASWCEQQALSTSPETAARLLEIGWDTDVRDSARKIQCPTLALHVERDTVVPVEVGRDLASLIPGCRFMQFEGENHMPLATEPAWQQDNRRRLRNSWRQAKKPHGCASTALSFEDLTERERDVARGDRERPRQQRNRRGARHV